MFFLSVIIYGQEFNYLPHSSNDNIIRHKYYTLSFVSKYRQAEWVAYKLTKEMAEKAGERSNKFTPDPLLPDETNENSAYKNSGYDKGHLCPAADMSWSQEAMDETFYYSNISPQQPGFNRNIWKKLEEYVRTWAKEDSIIYVVTGGVLTDNLETIGAKVKIPVPDYFYKVIYHPSTTDPQGIAFIMANKKLDKPVSYYAVSIDSVESLTHIDFFPNLPDKIENKVEKKINLAKWNLENSGETEKTTIAKKRCVAITQNGKRCKRTALPGCNYCKQHMESIQK